MPSYRIEAPDGRSLLVEGDTPPTEQEAEELFAAQPKPPEASATAKRPSLGERAKANLTAGFAQSTPGLLYRKGLALPGTWSHLLGLAYGAPKNDEEYSKFSADYQAMPGAEGFIERTVAIGSNVAGGAVAPENAVPVGRGATLGRTAAKGAVAAGGTNLVTDTAIQAGDMATGVQKDFDYYRSALSTLGGAALGGAINAIPDLKLAQRLRDYFKVGKAEVPEVKIKAIAPDAKEGEELAQYVARRSREIQSATSPVSAPAESYGLPNTGWWTPLARGGERVAELQSMGLPEGKFFALDKPFESSVHDASRAVKLELPKNLSIYDPDGVLGQKSRDISGGFVAEVNKANPENIRGAYADFLRKRGYNAYVRAIDGQKGNRELIYFGGGGGAPKAFAPKAANVGNAPLDINTDSVRDLMEKTLDQLDNVAVTGTVQPKPARPGFTMAGALPNEAKVSPGIVQETNRHLVEIGTLVKNLRREADFKADEATSDALKAAEKMFGDAMKKWQTARKTAGLSLREYQNGIDGIRRIARLIPEMQDVGKKLPILNSLVKNVREMRGTAALKDLVDYSRQNMFGLMSVNLDLFGNMIATAVKTPGWIAADAYDLVTKGHAERLSGILRSISNPRKAFRIPEGIKRELGTTFSGEQARVMIDKPGLDWALALPVKLKGAADSYFGTTFAAADLYSSAIKEARKRNLRGVDKERFIEAFIKNPSDEAAQSAIDLGSRLKFNRKLTKLEEGISSSLGVKLFFDAYPRWSFQFTRWAGETLGMNVKFFNKVKNGQAGGADVAEYLATTATGWGGVALLNEFYDDIDFRTMEYVREDGNRVRLSNLAPIPDAMALAALIRGDTEKAKSAFQFSSVFGSQTTSLRGILSDLLRTTEQAHKGDFTAVQIGREMENMANQLIPGQAMLSAVESLVNPGLQEGFASNVPGVSSLLPDRPNVTTGEPMKTRQKLPIVGIEVPAIRGVAFPGATKIVNPVERALLEHGLATYRPRRSPLLSMAAPDVPERLRLEYETYLGQYTKKFLTPIVTKDTFYNAPFEVRRTIITNMRGVANRMAKLELQRKHRDFKPAPEVPSNNVRLLPERILNEEGVPR